MSCKSYHINFLLFKHMFKYVKGDTFLRAVYLEVCLLQQNLVNFISDNSKY